MPPKVILAQLLNMKLHANTAWRSAVALPPTFVTYDKSYIINLEMEKEKYK